MSVLYLSNTDYYVWMHYKYKNTVFPILPELITSYIIDNPDKLDLYLDKKVKVDKLLEYVANKYKESKENKLLDYVIEFVEGPKCM